jgi:hypothetical protein
VARYETRIRIHKSAKLAKRIKSQNKTKFSMKITTTPEVVWEKCVLDIVGPLRQTLEGKKYVLTFQDELSKYTLAIPIKH